VSAPEVLKDFLKQGFKVTLPWTKNFMKTHFNWSYKATTIATKKLSKTWQQEGIAMAHKVAYLVKTYNIPACLVINIDQTRVHLVPNKSDKT